MFCFDTDILSAALRRNPSLAAIRRLAVIPASCQFTTAITYGELLYGASKRGSSSLADRVRGLLAHAITILPFDDAAAERYGSLRASLELEGKPLDEPDLRIAAIALSRSLILVTGNVRPFERVDGLEIQNWLDPESRPTERAPTLQ